MACKRSSVRPRYSPLSSQEDEIFDILTHKTVSKDFKLKTELYDSINSQFTAESMSYAACIIIVMCGIKGESKLGRLVDALALGGDEGRDKLR